MKKNKKENVEFSCSFKYGNRFKKFNINCFSDQ